MTRRSGRWKDGEIVACRRGSRGVHCRIAATVGERFQEKLKATSRDENWRRASHCTARIGMILRLLADERDLRTYGSRGQQRSAALSLKLAEVQAMTDATGAAPLLLLDDVMSELDAKRRSTLLEALAGVEQAIVTTTDWDDFSPDFRATAHCLHVQRRADFRAADADGCRLDVRRRGSAGGGSSCRC